MTEAIITLRNIVKTYHTGEVDVPVLRGIDLDIGAGEYVAIMGRSGAGKSTLMNIIGCLDRPTSGEYILAGEEVSKLHDDALSGIRGRTIGFVFQSCHLLGSLNVVENVELPMEYQNIPAAERTERAKGILERVGLGHRFSHRPSQLSGGERQRVAIARSLANRPRLLLADEPTGNLDSGASQRILDLFAALQDETGFTLIVVTHDDAIGRAARRLVRVADGVVVEDRR
jgi:putative ABC transport system ATP-binding protein